MNYLDGWLHPEGFGSNGIREKLPKDIVMRSLAAGERDVAPW